MATPAGPRWPGRIVPDWPSHLGRTVRRERPDGLHVVDCIFCAIVAGDAPAEVVHETDDAIAFLDVAPWTRGHTLVVPREHHDDWWDVPRSLAATLAAAAHDVARLARDRLGAEGVNLFNATRAVAWQTVFHLHVHVVPRWAGDGLPAPHQWVDHAPDHDRAAVGTLLRGDGG